MFKVGDRVRWRHAARSLDTGNGMTITAITDRGFRWRLDQPHTIHPLFGSYQEGECFVPEHYELIPADDSSAVPAHP